MNTNAERPTTSRRALNAVVSELELRAGSDGVVTGLSREDIAVATGYRSTTVMLALRQLRENGVITVVQRRRKEFGKTGAFQISTIIFPPNREARK